jgi:hypothetical protein
MGIMTGGGAADGELVESGVNGCIDCFICAMA